MVICKLAIAKKDEEIITDKIGQYQKQIDEIERHQGCIEMRLNNLNSLSFGEPNYTILPTIEKNVEGLQNNYKEFIEVIGSEDKSVGIMDTYSKLSALPSSDELIG